jgi:hypothetical protein
MVESRGSDRRRGSTRHAGDVMERLVCTRESWPQAVSVSPAHVGRMKAQLQNLHRTLNKVGDTVSGVTGTQSKAGLAGIDPSACSPPVRVARGDWVVGHPLPVVWRRRECG